MDNSFNHETKQFEVLNHAPVGMFVIRKDYCILFWNRCLEDWTGILGKNIIGYKLGDFFQHFNGLQYKSRLETIFQGGPPTIFSSQLHSHMIPSLLHNGEPRIQRTTVTAVPALNNFDYHALFAIEDITEVTRRMQDYRVMRDQAIEEIRQRKLAEQALVKHNERFRSLVESTSDFVWEIDVDNIYTYVSPNIKYFIGYNANELIEKSIFTYFLPDKKDEYIKFLKKAIASKKPFSQFEIQILHKNGKDIVIFEASGVPFFDIKGNFAGYRGIDRDITQRKKMEENLLNAKKLDSLGVLAGGIAHDFNNLLTGILGNISLAKIDAPKIINQFLEDAERASLRAKELTRQLLTFSKGGAPIKKIASIEEVISESASFTLRGSKVKGNFNIRKDLWSVEIDAGQISQVINNLVVNAMHAMPDGGNLNIFAQNIVLDKQKYTLKPGKYIQVNIEDEGIGIPPENINKIFDPYFSTKKDGHGLGLAGTYSIIKQHDGYINVKSTPGLGTIFNIYIPASSKLVEKKKEQDRKIVCHDTYHAKILVMDDEEIIRNLTGQMLMRIGYKAHTVSDGKEMIELYSKAMDSRDPFDIVIMDLTIPGGMGGKEAISKLIEIDPKVKAIVASGYFNDPVMANYRQYGLKGVITKPYNMNQLSDTLEKVMNGE